MTKKSIKSGARSGHLKRNSPRRRRKPRNTGRDVITVRLTFTVTTTVTELPTVRFPIFDNGSSPPLRDQPAALMAGRHFYPYWAKPG